MIHLQIQNPAMMKLFSGRYKPGSCGQLLIALHCYAPDSGGEREATHDSQVIAVGGYIYIVDQKNKRSATERATNKSNQ